MISEQFQIQDQSGSITFVVLEPTPLCLQAGRSSAKVDSVKAAVLAGWGIAASVLLVQAMMAHTSNAGRDKPILTAQELFLLMIVC